jgi:hypothetical protein
VTRPAQITAILGAVCAALFSFAFVAAPHSCEWGLTAYFWVGASALVALFAVPIVMRTDRDIFRRALLGSGCALLVLVVWIAGLFAANVRIMCRLF